MEERHEPRFELRRVTVKKLWGRLDIDFVLAGTKGATMVYGSNGAGKTTVLRMVSELLSAGDLLFLEQVSFDSLVLTLQDPTGKSPVWTVAFIQEKGLCARRYMLALTRGLGEESRSDTWDYSGPSLYSAERTFPEWFKAAAEASFPQVRFLLGDEVRTAPVLESISEEHLPAFLARLSETLKPYTAKIGVSGFAVLDPTGRAAPLQRLSFGQQRWITLLGVLHGMKPGQLLVFDEPEKSLHIWLQHEFYRELHDLLAQRGCSALIATHSPYIAAGSDDDELVELGANPEEIQEDGA